MQKTNKSIKEITHSLELNTTFLERQVKRVQSALAKGIKKLQKIADNPRLLKAREILIEEQITRIKTLKNTLSKEMVQ